MKGTIRLDHLNKNILITAAFARASMNPDTCEYKKLVEIRMLHPDYSVVKRSIKKNPEKQVYKNLTYDYMREYVSRHPRAKERSEELEEMILRAKCHLEKYGNVKKWFLAAYPDISDFTPAQFEQKRALANPVVDNFEVIEEAKAA